MVRPKKHWTGTRWWLYLRLLSTYLASWRQKRWAQQEEGSLVWAWTTDPTISTCPLTYTSSTSRESVRHAPCPDSPSHSRKALKVASPTAKARGDPGPAALQDSPRHCGGRQPLATNCCPSPSGCWPAPHILGFRAPGDFHVICLSLTIHRASEDVAGTWPSSTEETAWRQFPDALWQLVSV
jgi:hypothetical protein